MVRDPSKSIKLKSRVGYRRLSDRIWNLEHYQIFHAWWFQKHEGNYGKVAKNMLIGKYRFESMERSTLPSTENQKRKQDWMRHSTSRPTRSETIVKDHKMLKQGKVSTS